MKLEILGGKSLYHPPKIRDPRHLVNALVNARHTVTTETRDKRVLLTRGTTGYYIDRRNFSIKLN